MNVPATTRDKILIDFGVHDPTSDFLREKEKKFLKKPSGRIYTEILRQKEKIGTKR